MPHHRNSRNNSAGGTVPANAPAGRDSHCAASPAVLAGTPSEYINKNVKAASKWVVARWRMINYFENGSRVTRNCPPLVETPVEERCLESSAGGARGYCFPRNSLVTRFLFGSCPEPVD